MTFPLYKVWYLYFCNKRCLKLILCKIRLILNHATIKQVSGGTPSRYLWKRLHKSIKPQDKGLWNCGWQQILWFQIEGIRAYYTSIAMIWCPWTIICWEIMHLTYNDKSRAHYQLCLAKGPSILIKGISFVLKFILLLIWKKEDKFYI